jgi:hypothetical protein
MKQPEPVKNLLCYMRLKVTVQDLIDFLKGEYYSDGILDLYMKILETINHMLQDLYYEKIKHPKIGKNSKRPNEVLFFYSNFFENFNDPQYGEIIADAI